MAAAPVPINTGPKWGKGIGCGYSLRRQGTWAGRKGAMMAYSVLWRCWEETWRRWGIQAAEHTRAGRRGLVPYLNELASLHEFVLGWLYTPRRRPSAAPYRGLWPIAAFGRRRPRIAAFGRRRRTRDRDRCCNCRSMNSKNLRWHPAKFWPFVIDHKFAIVETI